MELQFMSGLSWGGSHQRRVEKRCSLDGWTATLPFRSELREFGLYRP